MWNPVVVTPLLGPGTLDRVADLGSVVSFEDDVRPALAEAGLDHVYAQASVRTSERFTSVWIPTSRDHIRESLATADLTKPLVVGKVLGFVRRIALVYAASSSADGAVLVRLGNALTDEADRIEAMLALEPEVASAPRKPDRGGQMSSGRKPRVTIDKAAIARMMRDIQREFDQHKIRIPVSAESAGILPGGTTNVYNGPVIQGDANGAQLAWGNETVHQNQHNIEEIAPGYEALALAVTRTLEGLAAVDIPEEDRRDAETAATEILREVTRSRPDRGLIRRSVSALKGLLAPLALAAQAGVSDEVRDWARTAIEQLGSGLGG